MKVTLKAGAELDLLTATEVREVLAAWHTEIRRGVRWRQFSAHTIDSGATFALGGLSDARNDVLGPAEGMIWAVTRIAVSGAGFNPAADAVNVFVDEVSPTKFVATLPAGAASTAAMTWTVPGLVLDGGSRLAVTGGSTGTAGGDIVLGAATVILAMGEGRRAAAAINEVLQ